MLSWLKQLPNETFHGNNGPYLTRYTLTHSDTFAVYIHEFHRSDEDEELHSHPFNGTAIILTGSYLEDRRVSDNEVRQRVLRPGDVNLITDDTYHKVTLLTPKVWTIFFRGERRDQWWFWNPRTGRYTPWREFIETKNL